MEHRPFRRLAVAVAALAVLAAPSVARADAVTDWSLNAQIAILNVSEAIESEQRAAATRERLLAPLGRERYE